MTTKLELRLSPYPSAFSFLCHEIKKILICTGLMVNNVCLIYLIEENLRTCNLRILHLSDIHAAQTSFCFSNKENVFSCSLLECNHPVRSIVADRSRNLESPRKLCIHIYSRRDFEFIYKLCLDTVSREDGIILRKRGRRNPVIS